MGDASDKGQGMLRTIMTTKLDLGPLVQCGVSKAGIDFVVGMLKVEPGLRRSELKCVQHEWLQGIAEENDEMQIEEEEQELAAIAEEEDGDDALDASQLSIHEAPNREIGDSEDEEVSEVEEINMEAGFAQYGQPGPSEIADVSYPSLPQVNESVTQQFNTHQPAPNRLFGEIGLSALESSGALGQNAPFALAMPFGSTEGSSGSSSDPDHGFGDDSLASASHNGNDVRAAPQYLHQPHGANHAFDQPGAPSLLGAESLVGQLNMASTPTTTSATSRPKDAATGHTLGHTQTFSVSGSKRLVDPEDTIDVDKASKRPRIEPCSETTKTTDEVEEMGSFKATSSSNIGGNDSFSRAKSAVALTASQANKIALEKTFDESAVSHGNSPNKENIDATTSTSLLAGTGEQEMSTGGAKGQNPEAPRNQAFSINATEQGKSADATQSSNFVRPQALMGQVTTLPGSIYDITLDINHRVTTWGRDPPNGPGMHAIVFPQPNDTRIPKYALAILFHCPGMRDAPETNTQWKKWKGTQPVIFTQSRQHIYVNGVKLRSTSPEGWPFGKLYTEDIITIWDDDKKKEFLKFRCTFYHGLSAVPRPKTGPKFVVETSDIGFEKEKAKTQEQSQGQATTGSVTQPMAPSTSTTT